jgi:hypothetical protein
LREDPLVSIDEAIFAHKMPQTHGYSPKGFRDYGTCDWSVKAGPNGIGTFLGVLLLTVSLFPSNINRKVFTGWVKDLLPKLLPRSRIVMNNETFHQVLAIKKTFEDGAHEFFTCPLMLQI